MAARKALKAFCNQEEKRSVGRSQTTRVCHLKISCLAIWWKFKNLPFLLCWDFTCKAKISLFFFVMQVLKFMSFLVERKFSVRLLLIHQISIFLWCWCLSNFVWESQGRNFERASERPTQKDRENTKTINFIGDPTHTLYRSAKTSWALMMPTF